MNIDYKKLTIKYMYDNNEFLKYRRPEPKAYDSYEDIPEDDRSPDRSGHMTDFRGIWGLTDSKRIMAAALDQRWRDARRYVANAVPFIAACRAVIALSPDEELTKEYAHWLKITEEGIVRELKREADLYDEITKHITKDTTANKEKIE
jgi:hypothetical protein